MFTGVLESMGTLGLRTLGYSGSKGRVHSTFRFPSSSVTYAYLPSELRSLFRSGISPFFCSRKFVVQGCHRTGILRTWLLQSPFCNTEGFVRLSHFHMETAHSVLQSLRPGDWMISIDLQVAYLQVPVHQESRRYLHFCIGERTFQFRVLCFGLSSAPQVFTRVMAPVSSIMHRFGFRILIYGRLASPWILPSRDQAGERLSSWPLFRARGSSKPCQELSDSFPGVRLPGDDSPLFTFEGFPDSSSCGEDDLSRRRVLLLSRAASQSLALSSRCDVIPVDPHSLVSSPDAHAPASSACSGPSVLSDRADLLGRLLPPRSSVVVRALPSRGRSRPLSPSSGAPAVYRRVRLGLERISRGRTAVRLVVSRCPDISINHRELLAGFPPSFPRPYGVSFHGQHGSAFIPPQGRGYSVFDPQLRGPGCSSPLQSQWSASAPPVCPWPPQRPCGLSQPRLSGTGVRMDSFHGGLSGAVPPLAGHGGCIRYISQPSAPGLLLPDGGSPGCGHRCDAPVLGSSPSLRLPTVWVHPALPHQGSPILQSGGDSGGSVLATLSMVPRSLGAPGGGTGPSTSVQGPAPATLPPLPSEPPSVRHDWVSHCQRAALHFGFSS